MTYIHLEYNVPNSNWWTPTHTTPHTVDHLLTSILESSHKIEQEGRQDKNESADMDRYLRSLYLLESLVGEGILENEATLDTVEALLLLPPSAGSKLAKKVQNFDMASTFLFPSFMGSPHHKSLEFTLELALTLHRIVGKDLIPNAGCFRQNWAGPSQETYVYLEPHLIESHLTALFTETVESLSKFDSLLSVVKITASFMTSFLHIHPFSNGNGRVVRLLIPLLLCKVSVVPVHVVATRIGRNTLLQCLRESRYSVPFKPEALARLLLESIEEVGRHACFCLDV
ncbi:fido domain-containing protein [Chytriomyces cf. hyalinus JEL632]|nr:fido domain-containing protein [Chytriomyces cf. hyalinus JEL632]